MLTQRVTPSACFLCYKITLYAYIVKGLSAEKTLMQDVRKSLMVLKRMFFQGRLQVLIKNVLVAVDGSENSDRVLDFGLDLAEKYVAAVTVLNVSESPAMGAVPMEPTTISGDNM